jgi:CRP-like cAMP-binding protein
MTLHICPKSSTFLTESTKKPDFFILIEGSLKVRQKTRKEFEVEPFEIFGCTKKLLKKPWVASTVTATEDSSIVSIPRRNFKRLVKEIFEVIESQKLLEFLIKSVPGIKQLGQAGKEKVLTYFEKVYFKAGDLVIQEGILCDHAFVIETGECKLVSSKNPVRKGTGLYQGLVSKTTSCFNIAFATVGEWVGDDSLIRGVPIEFSVFAVGNVALLKISKENFEGGLSRETQAALREVMESKLRWRRERRKKISQVITKEIAGNNENDAIELKNNEKVYPVASKSTIKLITKRKKAKCDRKDSPDSGKSRDFLNESRPKSSFSGFRESYHRKIASCGNDEKRIKLYNAGTLGYSLVPVVSIRQNFKPTENLTSTIRRKNTLGSDRRNFNSFSEMVRHGRPASPNPAEIWARSHKIKL